MALNSRRRAGSKKSAVEQKPKQKQAIDPFFEQVLEHPEDAALRQVWADALLERNDPLGEVISIQIAAGAAGAAGAAAGAAGAAEQKLTPAQRKRLRSLIAKHRVEWLGDLAGIVQHREGLVFDRGVLDACQVQVKSIEALERAIGSPLWKTVRRIWFCDAYAWNPRIVPLLLHPVFRSLRSITCVGVSTVLPLLAMHETPLPFESIWTINDSFRMGRSPTFSLEATPALPRLKRLGFTQYDNADGIFDLPVLHNIETLGLTTNTQPADRWRQRAEPIKNLKMLELRSHWIPMQGESRSHYVLRFTRGAGGRFSRLSIEPVGLNLHPKYNLADDLESIPKDALEHIETNAPLIRKYLERFASHAEIVVPRAPRATAAKAGASARSKRT